MPRCFNVEANKAITIIITHCPSANMNNNAKEKTILPEIVANAKILASKGEEQGLAAKAKKAPTKNGNRKNPPFLFLGIFLTKAGKCISKSPKRFKPNIIITDAKTSITTGEATDVKALPVIAQSTPIILNTAANPKEKEIICTNNFLFPPFEYPPTYPIINGKIPRLQGDNEAIIPAKKAAINISGTKKAFPEYAEKVCIILSIYSFLYI